MNGPRTRIRTIERSSTDTCCLILKARGKAVVVISHDDRYYHLGDRIVKLEDGKLVTSRA